MAAVTAGYEADLVEWSAQQAALLRRMAAGERVNDQVDWANIAEEIESLGRSDRRELRNRLRAILVHLIKLQTSPSAAPRAGWRETILEQRERVSEILADSPSLRPAAGTIIGDELPKARTQAATSLADYSEQPSVDPAGLSYTVDQVLGPWLP